MGTWCCVTKASEIPSIARPVEIRLQDARSQGRLDGSGFDVHLVVAVDFQGGEERALSFRELQEAVRAKQGTLLVGVDGMSVANHLGLRR